MSDKKKKDGGNVEVTEADETGSDTGANNEGEPEPPPPPPPPPGGTDPDGGGTTQGPK